MAGYIGSKAVITSGVSASIDELNLIDGVTATTAELNYNDTGAAVGVVVASRTVTADANKDVASFRNITLTGELDAGSLDISGNADIDGTLETDALSIAGVAVTTTAAEINLIDGGTARGTTAIVDADGVLVNDAGTMRMTTMATLATYMGTKGLGPAYTSSATIPSSPNAGDWWLDTSRSATLYIYDSALGWLSSLDYLFGQGHYQANGSFSIEVHTISSIDQLTRLAFEGASLGQESVIRDTIAAAYHPNGGGSAWALSNSVRGVFNIPTTAGAGGAEMAYITMATDAVALDFGDLVASRTETPCGASHATRGVIAGGQSNNSELNQMDYITIASTGNATDFGNLSVARMNLPSQAMSSTTRSVFSGGSTGSSSNVMDYITVGSTGNATDFGNATAAVNQGACVNSTTRGIHAGGNGKTGAIDFITIGTTGNAGDFGDLVATTNARTAFHSSTIAFLHRGEEKVTIATAANATSSGFGALGDDNTSNAVMPGWIAANG